jgi:hypothetical protein
MNLSLAPAKLLLEYLLLKGLTYSMRADSGDAVNG